MPSKWPMPQSTMSGIGHMSFLATTPPPAVRATRLTHVTRSIAERSSGAEATLTCQGPAASTPSTLGCGEVAMCLSGGIAVGLFGFLVGLFTFKVKSRGCPDCGAATLPCRPVQRREEPRLVSRPKFDEPRSLPTELDATTRRWHANRPRRCYSVNELRSHRSQSVTSSATTSPTTCTASARSSRVLPR